MSREITVQGLLNLDEGLFFPGEELHTTIEFDGEAANLQIKQAFRNPTQATCAIAYLYPLPPNAVSPKLILHLEGKCTKPTEEERDAWYQSAKAPPVGEEEPEELFSIALDSLLPGQRLEVTLSYRIELQKGEDALLVLPPLNGPKRQVKEPAPQDETSPEAIERRLNAEVLVMNEALLEAKKQAAVAIADEKRLLMQYDASSLNAREWEKKAKAATQANNIADAEEFLKRGAEHAAHAAEYREQHRLHKEANDKLRVGLREFQNQFDETRRKKDVTIAKMKREQAEKTIQTMLSHLDERMKAAAVLLAPPPPRKLQELTTQELQEKLRTLEEVLKTIAAQEDRLRAELVTAQQNANEWAKKVAIGIHAGDDQLAKVALPRQQEHEAQITDLSEELRLQSEQNQKLTAILPLLREALERAERIKDLS